MQALARPPLTRALRGLSEREREPLKPLAREAPVEAGQGGGCAKCAGEESGVERRAESGMENQWGLVTGVGAGVSAGKAMQERA